MDFWTTKLPTPPHYHLQRTLSLLRMGTNDPTFRLERNQATFCLTAIETEDVVVHVQHHDDELTVECHGQNSDWIEPTLEAMLGLSDRPDGFRPEGRMRELVEQRRGTHLPRRPVVFHRLVQIVLMQLVTWADAFRGWRLLVDRFGHAAPGPFAMRCPPSPRTLRELGYYDLMGCGVNPRQARLILRLAQEASRLDRLATDPSALGRYLATIPGVGDWTIQYLLGSALGESDAVLTGDYHMPHTVAWFLAGEERGNDERMVELLEPFRGHRFRVVNLLWQSGITAPRRGPRSRTNRWRFTS